MIPIGDFSKSSGLSIKALRHYHEQGILIPAHIDPENSYRYYSEDQLETAIVVVKLKELGFSLREISELIERTSVGDDVLAALQSKLGQISDQIQIAKKTQKKLEQIIQVETTNRQRMLDTNYDVTEKQLDRMLIAGYRMTGRYQDCGKGFSKVGRHFGPHICGQAMVLYYDQEYKEDGADFEPCMPIRKGESKKEINVREIEGGPAITLMHLGPYTSLHRSYQKIFEVARSRGITFQVPNREVYHKGPGMIFKGNPDKYLTEIQFLIEA